MESSGVTNNVLKLILNSNFIKSPSTYLLMVSHFSYNIDLKAYAPTCVGSFFLHALSLWNSIAYKDSNSMMIGLTAVMKTLLTGNFVKLETWYQFWFFPLFYFLFAASSQNNWPGQCKDGSNQSPIKIDPTEDDFEKKQMDPFIFVNYNQSSKSDPKLKNIGHTINVMFDFENTPMVCNACWIIRKF